MACRKSLRRNRKPERVPGEQTPETLSLVRVTKAEGKGLEPSTDKSAPDFESTTKCPETREIGDSADVVSVLVSGQAETAASDAGLQVLIEAWPHLSENDRRRILAIVREASQMGGLSE